MMSYILLIVVTLAIGFGAQAYVNSQIKKYSLVPNSTRMTGYRLQQECLPIMTFQA